MGSELSDDQIKKWAEHDILSHDPDAVKDAKALAKYCNTLINNGAKYRKALEVITRTGDKVSMIKTAKQALKQE